MTNLQIAFLGLIFTAVAGLAYGLVWLTFPTRVARDRMHAAAGGAATSPSSQGGEWQATLTRLAAPLAKLALPAGGWESSGLRIRFMNAGLRHPSVPILYFGAKAGLALGLPLLATVILGISIGGSLWGTNNTLFGLLGLAAFGYYLPNVLLARRVRSYQRQVLNAFPDAIDLIIVCIEAGLGLDAAIARAAEEMRLRSPEMADELHLVGLELRVGASREEALRNLALRTGLDEVRALVTMLVQADRFGTSIAESLRVHAEGLRSRRQQRAEEAAAKIPLKLIFPLIFCIFPSLMLVLMGPAVISIYRIFIQGVLGN